MTELQMLKAKLTAAQHYAVRVQAEWQRLAVDLTAQGYTPDEVRQVIDEHCRPMLLDGLSATIRQVTIDELLADANNG